MFAIDVCDQIDVACQICKRGNRMGSAPKRCCDSERIDPMAVPPGALVAASVKLTMVQPANGHGEAVTDFAAHRPLLREFDVVGIRRGAAADQARLYSHKPHTVAVALGCGFADDSDLLRAGLAVRGGPRCLFNFRFSGSPTGAESREPRSERSFDVSRISGRELFLKSARAVRSVGGFEHGSGLPNLAVERGAHPFVDGMADPSLHILDCITRAALVPGSV
jgi:hypothetical protein